MASLSSTQPEAQMAMPHGAGRRHLVLSLPRWATDCLRRAEPRLTRPLVLWEKQHGGMRVVELDDRAAALGLSPGASLSDARAQVPDLEAREIDRAQVMHLFAEFADWHSNASPLVAVLDDQAPYGDLCLDITGVSHLFGGEDRMLAMLVDRLRTRGFTVAGAIAPTVGAAWALAHLMPGSVIADNGIGEALADLPIVGLRLDDAQIDGLRQMGLKRIGQLYGRDRKALAARFGKTLVMRLDQALGQVEERITPRLPIADHYAERRFAEPIGLCSWRTGSRPKASARRATTCSSISRITG
jgi:protein ImuB